MISLEEHINILFNDISINKNINFIDLWNEINLSIDKERYLSLETPNTYMRIIKNYYLFKYFDTVRNLEGDIFEAGVLRGFSALFLRRLFELRTHKYDSNFFLIDSFEGLSDINKEDKVENKNTFQHRKGHFIIEFDKVESLFKKYSNVFLIKGWIPEIFTVLDNNNKYKFVHLDVDLYQPTYDSLSYIFSKLVKGGVIITDDYKSKAFPGNKKAFNKFFLKTILTFLL